MSQATGLPDQIALEIAALLPFPSLDAARDKINGNNQNVGIRGRYLARLYDIAVAESLSDPFVRNIGVAIQTQCDAAVSAMKPSFDGTPKS